MSCVKQRHTSNFIVKGGAFCSPLLCFLLAGAHWGPLLSVKRWQLPLLWLWSACPCLWSLGWHFPVAASETSHSCSRVRKAQVWQSQTAGNFSAGGSLRMAPKQESPCNLSSSSKATVANTSGGREFPPNGRTAHVALFTSPHNGHCPLCPDRDRKKRWGN